MYAFFGMALMLGYLVGGLIVSSIYRATVATFPGLVFLVCGGFAIFCASAGAWIHFSHRAMRLCESREDAQKSSTAALTAQA